MAYLHCVETISRWLYNPATADIDSASGVKMKQQCSKSLYALTVPCSKRSTLNTGFTVAACASCELALIGDGSTVTQQ